MEQDRSFTAQMKTLMDFERQNMGDDRHDVEEDWRG